MEISSITKKILLIISLVICLFFILGASDGKDVNYFPVINPSNFIDSVTNKYFPLIPGKVYTYKSRTEEGVETTVDKVLSETKKIDGVKCTGIREIVTVKNEVTEDIYKWYAQDIDGNVWFMGENANIYNHGVLENHEGSFEAGVKGALPGLIIMANPVLELPYRQEYYLGEAEDWLKVVAKSITVTTPYGTFKNCIKIITWDILDPEGAINDLYFAPDVGFVKDEKENSTETVELIKIE